VVYVTDADGFELLGEGRAPEVGAVTLLVSFLFFGTNFEELRESGVVVDTFKAILNHTSAFALSIEDFYLR
jgi:hypothetical protein